MRYWEIPFVFFFLGLSIASYLSRRQLKKWDVHEIISKPPTALEPPGKVVELKGEEARRMIRSDPYKYLLKLGEDNYKYALIGFILAALAALLDFVIG
jgi:hypothetical protein